MLRGAERSGEVPEEISGEWVWTSLGRASLVRWSVVRSGTGLLDAGGPVGEVRSDQVRSERGIYTKELLQPGFVSERLISVHAVAMFHEAYRMKWPVLFDSGSGEPSCLTCSDAGVSCDRKASHVVLAITLCSCLRCISDTRRYASCAHACSGESSHLNCPDVVSSGRENLRVRLGRISMLFFVAGYTT